METIEITAGIKVEDIIKLLEELKKDSRFAHHVFKLRGTVDLVFEEEKEWNY